MDMRMLTAAMAMRADQRGAAVEAKPPAPVVTALAMRWFEGAPYKRAGGDIAGCFHSPAHAADKYHPCSR